MEYFSENKIISNDLSFYHKGVRDDNNINVFICSETGTLVLDHIKDHSYDKKGLSYWGCDSIDSAREKTSKDDCRRYNQIKNNNYKSIIDVGCGNGGLLKLIATLNPEITPIGIELNKHIAELLNNEGIKTYDHIDKIPKNISIDCIMLNHVLEHLYDPIKTLKEIKARMGENTILIIEVPHANDALIKKYGCDKFKKFTFWSEHLILYTQQSLKNLLNIVGFTRFEMSYYQRYGFFNHINWLTNGTPVGQIQSDNIKLVESYDEYLAKNKITDTLIAHCYI